jgi:CheY-like chemotaxis protein
MQTDLVLIADPNLGHARRLATALEAGGHRCMVAPHGAGALEAALTERPGVIVAQAVLPLVDSVKLAEILRANPRTRSTRFLFLGVEARRGRGPGGVGDLCLPPGAEAREIHDAIERLLERQRRIAALEARADDEAELEGSLAELTPAELLQLLHVRRVTGRLTLAPELDDGSAPHGWVELLEGELHTAEVGAARGEKALYRMLDWGVGDFHFEPRPVEGPAQIKTPTRSVLAEGLRQLAEWSHHAPRLPPMESPVKRVVDASVPPNTAHPLTREVLDLLSTSDRVADIVDRSGHPDYQVLRTLHALADRGIVEFGRARLAPPRTVGHALFHEAQVRRLRSFVAQGESRDAMVADAKLLVVAAEPACVETFAGLLAKVPGADVSPAVARGELRPDDLATLARIDIDGLFGIDLIHLPSGEGFAPLWPFAGHRALGTIFLLDARVGLSTERLQSVTAGLGRAPEARTFHVVLIAEGERLSPDELRENLSLIEEASLFLLPIETGKDPGQVLRSLFARIVP